MAHKSDIERPRGGVNRSLVGQTVVCEQCGQKTLRRTKNKRYCSLTCKRKASLIRFAIEHIRASMEGRAPKYSRYSKPPTVASEWPPEFEAWAKTKDSAAGFQDFIQKHGRPSSAASSTTDGENKSPDPTPAP